MNAPHSKYRCPACDQAVLNRAIEHCLYCGATLPAEYRFSDDKIVRLNKELKWFSLGKKTNSKQAVVNQSEQEKDFTPSESQKTTNRSDGVKVMDAIAGAVIGLVASTVLLLVISKRATWLSPWVCFWFVFACTFVSSVGSYVFGAEFLDRLFFKFRGK